MRICSKFQWITSGISCCQKLLHLSIPWTSFRATISRGQEHKICFDVSQFTRGVRFIQHAIGLQLHDRALLPTMEWFHDTNGGWGSGKAGGWTNPLRRRCKMQPSCTSSWRSACCFVLGPGENEKCLNLKQQVLKAGPRSSSKKL